VGEKENKLFHK